MSQSKPDSKRNTADENGTETHSLYRHFLDVREEILRHKWLKSEEAQEDIGFEAALTHWMKSDAAARSGPIVDP